ncbi:MAG: CDP-alcohol phosphatidyltransferase family protein [Anaerolineales bacterium]|jgi:CDP-diacylglycerol--glycerol-3-phosphate 3-phosphatidyltransferase
MAGHKRPNPDPLRNLRVRWLIYFLVNGAALILGFNLLSAIWQHEFALRWLGLTTAVIAYNLWTLWRGLPFNHRPGESALLSNLGAGNALTLTRGLFTAVLAGFLFSPWPEGGLAWIPGVLYLLVIVSDFFDGYLARITDHTTRLGEKLDLSLDGLGVLIGASLAVQYQQVPPWYLSVALARYLFLIGVWVRKKQAKPIYALPANISRRIFAGLQMGFVAVVLLPLFSPPGTHLAALFFALPFLIGFLRDGLAISGIEIVPPQFVQNKGPKLLHWLPLILRLLVAVLMLGPLVRRFRFLPDQILLFANRGVPAPEMTLLVLVLLEVLVLCLLLLGVSGRIAAILALLVSGANQIFTTLTPIQMALIVAYTAILFMGTGALSLWNPDQRLFIQRAGERPEIARTGNRS